MPQNVLVLNCGSSSLKFAIINARSGEQVISGLAERLGENEAQLKYTFNNAKQIIKLSEKAAHQEAINTIVEIVKQQNLDDALCAVGHRVVHGGEAFTHSVIVNDHVKATIAKMASLAPLHNPANLHGIEAAQAAFSDLPQIAVFDTAFHQTMPQHAFLYALPYTLYKDHGVRRYGFHGTSHFFVASHAANLLGKPLSETNLITAHLGNGCSVTAIKQGKSVDTSMGLTPLEGLVMGTRSGDIDPGLFDFLSSELNLDAKQISSLLNKESGLLGLSELSNDCREIEEAVANNHPQATLALEVFCYRLAKYIASYLVPVGKLDALVFTGGIGENSALIREKVVNHLAFLNLSLNSDANLAARFGNAGEIAHNTLGAKVLVVPTNEEWVIAMDSAKLVESC
jgi:acetate kinase